MQSNVGGVDAAVRAVLAVAALVGAAVASSFPILSLFLAVVALVLLGTALTRSCPLYRIIGLTTATTATRTRGG